MSCNVDTVRLCSFSHVVPACDNTDPNAPKPIMFVTMVDASGNVISTASTAYSNAGSGFTGDGSGYIRSYFTDLTGAPIATPASWGFDCASAAPKDVEVGCLIDSAAIAAAPVPVRAEFATDVAGVTTVTYISLATGAVVVPSATQTFETDCANFDYETQAFCVRDAAGNVVARVTRVRVYDTQAANPTVPLSEVLVNDATGAAYTLGAGETLGGCDVYAPLVFIVCIEDATVTPPTYTTARQLIPVINGAPQWTTPSYVDAKGAAVTVAATSNVTEGACKGGLCYTC